MQDDGTDKYFEENNECYDRVTFDTIFRFLLSQDFTHEDAKDAILYNCSLSAMVFQERIYNKYYKKITESETISKDLQQLRNEVFNKKFINNN